MCRRYILLLALAYHVPNGHSSPATTYDQRQTGDLNVQVHLKDVQVLALLDTELLDDYTEYDYFYDYADFTLKPIDKPTTSTTTSAITTEVTSSAFETTEKVNDTETPDSSLNSTSLSTSKLPNENATTEITEVLPSADVESKNETITIPSSDDSENSSNKGNASKRKINDKTRNLFETDEDASQENDGGLSTDNPSKRISRKRCKLGYSPDGRGRCRRLSQRRLSLIPLAMRLAPKLLDDLARNTKNLAQEEVDLVYSNRAVP
ncbi:uncharacterized protein LOC143430207 [Xylocopa sonorina]|uniref:uncharacterized protein LOC143430207 n=1 Tax=Xylocopa sonorina TaxID=1818115 RepID=UPI00403B167D